MLTRRAGKLSIIIVLIIGLPGVVYLVPNVLGLPEVYRLAPFPFRNQEGGSVSLVLDVSSVAQSTAYQFIFGVADPSNHVWISTPQNYTTLPGQQEFFLVVNYPSSSFNGTGGVNSLTGVYVASVTQTKPSVKNNVASTFFVIGLTDKSSYQRTQTVSIKATNYQAFEFVTVRITTSPGSVVVYNHPMFADFFGTVTDSWAIPVDADVSQTYVVTVTGTNTNKSPADIDSFTVSPAVVTVSSISTNRLNYQRTETVHISFNAIYPSNQNATTGSANVTIIRPNSSSFNITASYDSNVQAFVATYKLPIAAETGAWTARLGANCFDDGNGNRGPTTQVSTVFNVRVASLSVTTSLTKSIFVVNEQIPINATISYPDGSILGSAGGSASAQLSFSSGSYVTSFSLIFDTSTNQWEGLYVPVGNEPTGLWSLTVNGTDTASPKNTGLATNAITLNKRTTSIAVSCNPTNIIVGQQVTCTATVTDRDVGTAITPTGQVTISPAFANAQLCDLPQGSGSSASCSAIFVTRPQSTGSNSITASYGGDSHEALSSTTTSVTIQDAPPPVSTPDNNNILTLPLFWFALIAAIVAGVIGAFLAFRHKTTHTKLKIDLEAVRSEAGKIENQAFFQSVRDQLTKDKEDLDTGRGTDGNDTGGDK